MIDAKTRLIGLIGNPTGHSLSPAMHNPMFEKLHLNYRYLCFNVEKNELNECIKALKALNFAGANVTIPYKTEIMGLLDEIDPVAKKIGAVNTIVTNGKKLTGYNTDFEGIIKSLEEYTVPEGKSIVLIGAGGAARAVCYAMKEKKARVIILNRTQKNAKKLAEEFGFEYAGLDKLDSIKADILINSTSVGMYPGINESICTRGQLENFRIVFDIVYNPAETKLLRDAKKAGCKTIPGLKMLAYQAAGSFELWTGKKADLAFMMNSAKKEISGE